MEFAHLKKRYWSQHLWTRGFFVVTVGNVNSEDVQRYIEQQEEPHKQDDFKYPSTSRWVAFMPLVCFASVNHTAGL